jgi:hypothetical protein
MLETAARAAMMALCAYAASVQLNDPDAPVWFSLYVRAVSRAVLRAVSRAQRSRAQ